jgi:heme/copper-type cytochrome/quinol oxidase subunit 4
LAVWVVGIFKDRGNQFNLGGRKVDELVYGLIIFGLSLAVLGSLILALLHGLGFSIFGYKEIRPSYFKRWLMSFMAGIIGTLLLYLMGSTITLTPDNMMSMVIFYALIIVAVNHLSLSIITYFVFDAKGDKGAALKTPFLITGLLAAAYLIPSIWFVSKM